MTDETQTTEPKEKPDFYIFQRTADGKNTRIGAAFQHRKGDGFTILIGDNRFSMFPPKPEQA